MTTKPKISIKFALFSNFTDLIQVQLICQMFSGGNSLGSNPKGHYLDLEKGEVNFCVVFT